MKIDMKINLTKKRYDEFLRQVKEKGYTVENKKYGNVGYIIVKKNFLIGYPIKVDKNLSLEFEPVKNRNKEILFFIIKLLFFIVTLGHIGVSSINTKDPITMMLASFTPLFVFWFMVEVPNFTIQNIEKIRSELIELIT